MKTKVGQWLIGHLEQGGHLSAEALHLLASTRVLLLQQIRVLLGVPTPRESCRVSLPSPGILHFMFILCWYTYNFDLKCVYYIYIYIVFDK